MPYYSEGKINDYMLARFQPEGGAVVETPFIKSMIELSGYRSEGAKTFPHAVMVPDHIADPYAYFFTSERDRKFDNALKARGLAAWVLPADTGHNFFSRKREFLGTPFTGYVRRNSSGATSGGENLILQPSAGFTDLYWISEPVPDYSAVAQQLYARAAPRSEVFDLANFVGELREGLPSIVPSLLKGKANVLKNAGSDYLNVQFGWIPFLNDLQNAALALQSATTALLRPSGIVRRERSRRPTVTSSEANGTYAQMKTFDASLPSWVAQQIDGVPPIPQSDGSVTYPAGFSNVILNGSSYWSSVTKVERWFEGEFVQLPHIGFNPDDYLSRLNELMNPRITPEVLWNLAPWSWLVDWHLRIGDSIAANLLAVDDRVHSVFAYAMQRTQRTVFVSAQIDSAQARYSYVGPREWGGVLRTTVKQRVRANPYGFTAGGADALNESQLAILAALGLTKVGR
jgi:hypothetical protein